MFLLKLIVIQCLHAGGSSLKQGVLNEHEWQCGTQAGRDYYDSVQEQEDPADPPLAKRPFNAKSEEWLPFKTLFILPDNTTQEHRAVLVQFLESINQRLGVAIKSPSLSEVRFGRRTCDPVRCGQFFIPEEFNLPCKSQNATPSGRVVQWNNANYSLVVYVTIQNHTAWADRTRCTHTTKAYAIPCRTSLPSHRVTHGMVHICSSNIFRPDLFEFSEQTLMHETMHLIVTDLDQAGNKKLCPEGPAKCKDVTWKEVNRRWKLPNETVIDQPVFLSITPSVQKAVRDHFGCADVEGAEVEKEWNETDQSWVKKADHWSYRLFPDELMSPRASTSLKLSALTLAAVNDSGWYRVNMSVTELLPLRPVVRGCDVAKKSSYEVAQAAGASTDEKEWHIFPYCIHNKGPLCSPDGTMPLKCIYKESAASNVSAPSRPYQTEHPFCQKKAEIPSAHRSYGSRVGNNTMCVTITKLQSLPEITAMCFTRICRHDSKEIIISAIPENTSSSNLACEFTCPADFAYKIRTHQFRGECKAKFGDTISYFCPNMTEVCEPPKVPASTAAKTTTEFAVANVTASLKTTNQLTTTSSSARQTPCIIFFIIFLYSIKFY